jgi:fructokinase
LPFGRSETIVALTLLNQVNLFMENPNSDVQIVAAGEALMDMIVRADGSLMPHDGGAVYNLARALGLAGARTMYLNPLSADRFGQGLRHALEKAGVLCTPGEPVAQPTSLAVVGVDGEGKASYSFYREGVADRQTSATELTRICQQLPRLQVVCTGCLALLPADQTTYLPWLQAMRDAGKTVVVDANLRPAVEADTLAYRASVMAALRLAHGLKASDDDLQHLGFHQHDPVDAARALMRQTGAHWMALTLGPRGAVLLMADGRAWHASETIPVTLVDTVGAGDCFLAGMLGAWMHLPRTDNTPLHGPTWTDEQLQQVLSWGVASATLCVQRAGCQPPTRTEVQQRLAQSTPACKLL